MARAQRPRQRRRPPPQAAPLPPLPPLPPIPLRNLATAQHGQGSYSRRFLRRPSSPLPPPHQERCPPTQQRPRRAGVPPISRICPIHPTCPSRLKPSSRCLLRNWTRDR